MSLNIVIGGETRIFNLDGTVSALVAGTAQQKGHWRSAADEKDNRIRYTIDGAEQDPLFAGYAFSDSNQLAVTLSNDSGAASKAFAFPGRILIDDNHDLIYRVVDGQGNDTATDIAVYGVIAFEESTNDLAISLARGGETTKIIGDGGVQSLEAGRNDLAGFDAHDLLVFHASTTNTFPDQDAVTLSAECRAFLARRRGDEASGQRKEEDRRDGGLKMDSAKPLHRRGAMGIQCRASSRRR